MGIEDYRTLGPLLVVPNGYVSGAPLSGTLTFTGTDLATRGLTPGSYVCSWGSGPHADSLTLNVIPEPTSAALLGLGGGLAFVALRRVQRFSQV